MTFPSHTILPYGEVELLVGTLFIALSATCLKFVSASLANEMAIQMGILFIPSMMALLYFQHVQINSLRNSEELTKSPTFEWNMFLKDEDRLHTGLFTVIYVLGTCASFKLLPLTTSIPLLMTYPAIEQLMMAFGNRNGHTSVRLLSYLQMMNIFILFSGVGILIWNTPSVDGLGVGIGLGFIGAVSLAMRVVYKSHSPTLGVPVRRTVDVLEDHPENTIISNNKMATTAPSLYHLAIQLIETSAIGLVVFGIVSILIAFMPNTWLNSMNKTFGVPLPLVSAEYTHNNGNGKLFTFAYVAVVYLVFTLTGNTLQLMAHDTLSYVSYTSWLYVIVFFAFLFGHFILDEHVGCIQLLGMVLVVLGGIGTAHTTAKTTQRL